MKISGVIFDMDGLIFDSESLWKMGFIEGNKKFGVNLTEEFRQSICGNSEEMIRDKIAKIYPSLDVNTYRDYIIKLVGHEIEEGHFTVKEGFMEMIAYFKGKGIKVALATSSFRGRAESMFRKKGMDLYNIFDAYSFLEDVGANSKPNPYIFKVTADKMNIEYSECMVLEDSINGIHAAVNGGMIPVHVRDLIAPDDFLKEHCYLLLDSLLELKNYV